ncbi:MULTISPECIES: HAD family phosphatase [unclassified Pseudoclavibacter]|uniref:HAD family hydrolase n=1 Tax=unclassified Pseudoclavibacter TaxID=2615177 RepID=UPI000CE862F4|nr:MULTISPECIES: HAD family hydrolase [unclassified Pseudoclavibacter]MBF4550248.1 HAD family hydrolase [Pseudoclavibacter sp. VKM Ac-2888]PPF32790.1 haloacid dehalogenase [Pseudoclavibacter sp. AY1H1]PPF74716.1 haloacid dehalogenase [Pseudoclavibacter sp. Z016]PPG05298.1 haloacid dehalogenase [Pseudoclavibacter sp. RFBI5]
MSPVELVIFDCDGVLVDSEVLAVRIEREMLAELGWQLTQDEHVARFLGTSQATFERKLQEGLGRPVPEGWFALQRETLFRAFDTELTAVDGLPEALAVIQDELGLASCVASSGDHAKLSKTLGHTGLHPRFEGRIYSATEVENGKPAPDLFLHAADRMGVDPATCVVVEDSAYGVQAAVAAGMHAYGFAGGLTPRAWLEDAGAQTFERMAELPALIRDRQQRP